MSKETFYEKIQKELLAKGMALKSQEAIQWLRGRVKALQVTRKTILDLPGGRPGGTTVIGKMYFFGYDPKTKNNLEYYDVFPLVIPIEQYRNGFLGLNLHYLPYELRLRLFSELQETQNNKKYNSTTRMLVSYDILKRFASHRLVKPCVKRYLSSHINTKVVEVPALNWSIAVFLPVERFKKKSKTYIWRDSVDIISNS